MNVMITNLCLIIAVHSASLDSVTSQFKSDDFWERENAHTILKEQLKVPWEELLIKRLREDHKDAEANKRVEDLTKEWDNFLISDFGKYPYIAALPKDWPQRDIVINGYTAWAARELPGCCFFNGDWSRHATYLLLKDLRVKGAYMSEIRDIQRVMIYNEKYFYDNGKYP